MASQTILWLATSSLLFLTSAAVCAAPEATPQATPQATRAADDPLTKGGQSSFAFGAQVGWYQATGAALQLGSPDIALGLSGGFVPIIFNDRPNTIKLLPSGQVDGDVLIRLATISGTTPLGLRVGYRFNSVLGHGFALGGYAERRLSKVIALSGSYGLTCFPGAFSRLEDEGYDPFGIAGIIGGGLSIGILIYP